MRYILSEPFIITDRLLPGIKVGDDFCLSVEPEHIDRDGRTRWSWWLDGPDGELGHEKAVLGTHVKSDDPAHGAGEALETLLSFMGAAAEAYRYDMAHGPGSSDNGDMFAPEIMEWCYMNDSEIQYAELDLGDEEDE